MKPLNATARTRAFSQLRLQLITVTKTGRGTWVDSSSSRNVPAECRVFCARTLLAARELFPVDVTLLAQYGALIKRVVVYLNRQTKHAHWLILKVSVLASLIWSVGTVALPTFCLATGAAILTVI